MVTGRNLPCPCGSGRKYKHCHGQARPPPPVPAAAASRAVALLQSGRAAEAEAEAEKLLARDPGLGAAWACLGFARQQQGKDPIPALEAASRALPLDATVQHLLGQALEERGLLAQAAQSLERAATLRPGFAETHNDLGRVRLALGDVPGAVASCRRALELRPDFAEAHGNLANADRARGAIGAAIDGYRRVIALEPRLALAHRQLGKALNAAGDAAGAIASLMRAVELAPDDADALAELGAGLVSADRAIDALPHFERLVALRPEAALLGDYATLLVRFGRYEEAVHHYRAAIARIPSDARLHSNLAHALHCGGDYHGAIDAARRSLALDDRLPEAHLHLGNALLALSEVPQADECYRDGLAVATDHPALLTARAMSLRALGRLDDAEATARRALEVRRAPDLLTLLGNLAADHGHFEEAADRYQEALSLAPELPEALVGITRSRRMTAVDGAWRTAAERALARGIPVPHAVNLHHALGKYHEDLGESEAAFCAHATGNALARRSGPAYDRAATTARIDAIMSAYDRPTLSSLADGGAGVSSDRPVFIVGMPRSGTTLAEQILASHPAVHGADELLFWNLAADLAGSAPPGERARAINQLATRYLALLARHSAAAARVIDKLPGNFENVGLIHAALPMAKFIHLQRDPRDTCLSIFFQGFTAAHAYATDLEDLAHYFREYRRLMPHWRETLPAGTVLDIQYEALVADPETWTRRMLEHIGLPWEARCLEFHRTERPVMTASSWQVRQPLHSSSVGRWQRYRQSLEPLIQVLGDEL